MIDIPSHIRGLVFDCDGTIADTMPLHYKAWLHVLGSDAAKFPEALFYELAGMPTLDIIHLLNERHGCRLDPETTRKRKSEHFLRMLPEVKPIEPVVRLIREHAGKLPMAVATSGTRSSCCKTLEALGLLDVFRAIVTADDVERGKPAPDLFLTAAKRLGVDPSVCLAFEDADLGIEAARAAGMEVVDIRPLVAENHDLSSRAS
ncbi:MAG: HAD family hydrolase [Candidatus Sumerlaeaceae bacterium]